MVKPSFQPKLGLWGLTDEEDGHWGFCRPQGLCTYLSFVWNVPPSGFCLTSSLGLCSFQLRCPQLQAYSPLASSAVIWAHTALPLPCFANLSSRQKHLPSTLCLVSALTVCPITTSTACEKSAWLIAGTQGVFVEQVNEMACVNSGLEGLPENAGARVGCGKCRPPPKKTKIRDKPKMVPNFCRAEKASVL